jgi:hypothetical protein
MGLHLREAMRLIACTAICVWLCLTSAAAAGLVVDGTVTAGNGTPLAGVAVRVEIRSEATAAPTDTHGCFALDAAKLFSADELRDAMGLTLKFSKTGFQPVNKFVRLYSGQTPGAVTIRLDPTGGSAALDPAEKQALDKYAAAPGNHPLFLIPYELMGIQAVDARKVNEMLRSNLERVIVTHLQASSVGGSSLISLKLLPVATAHDIDQMRVYGNYLNALGMITGVGAVEAATGGPGSLEVSSTFLVIPQVDYISAPVLYVDDTLPADRVLSPRLYQYLSKLWGRSTLLALGASEFGQAKKAKDQEALKRVRRYLQTERAGAGPGDQALVSQLNALIEAVDKELLP